MRNIIYFIINFIRHNIIRHNIKFSSVKKITKSMSKEIRILFKFILLHITVQ